MSTEEQVKQIDDFLMMLNTILDRAFDARESAEKALHDGARVRQKLREQQLDLLREGNG